MNTEAVGMAVRVLGTAVLRELVVEEARAVRIYGRGLDVRELQWLVEGMRSTQHTALTDVGPKGEAWEIAGTVLGQLLRIHLTQERYRELNGALAYWSLAPAPERRVVAR